MSLVNQFKDLQWAKCREQIPELEEKVEKKKTFDLIEEGYHNATIESIELKKSKAGKDYLNFTFRLDDSNRCLFRSYFPFGSEGGRQYFEYVLRNLGLDKEQREAFNPAQIKAFFGLSVNLNVKHEYSEYHNANKEVVNIAVNKYVDRADVKRRLKAVMDELKNIEEETFPDDDDNIPF